MKNRKLLMPVRYTTRKFYPQSVCCRNDLSASSQPCPMTVALIGSSRIGAERYASFCHRFGDMSQTRPIMVLKQTGDHSRPLYGSWTWKVISVRPSHKESVVPSQNRMRGLLRITHSRPAVCKNICASNRPAQSTIVV